MEWILKYSVGPERVKRKTFEAIEREINTKKIQMEGFKQPQSDISLFESLKSDIKTVLSISKKGIPALNAFEQMSELIEGGIRYEELGFANFGVFLCELSDILQVRVNCRGEYYIFLRGGVDKGAEHIRTLVEGQQQVFTKRFTATLDNTTYVSTDILKMILSERKVQAIPKQTSPSETSIPSPFTKFSTSSSSSASTSYDPLNSNNTRIKNYCYASRGRGWASRRNFNGGYNNFRSYHSSSVTKCGLTDVKCDFNKNNSNKLNSNSCAHPDAVQVLNNSYARRSPVCNPLSSATSDCNEIGTCGNTLCWSVPVQFQVPHEIEKKADGMMSPIQKFESRDSMRSASFSSTSDYGKDPNSSLPTTSRRSSAASTIPMSSPDSLSSNTSTNTDMKNSYFEVPAIQSEQKRTKPIKVTTKITPAAINATLEILPWKQLQLPMTPFRAKLLGVDGFGFFVLSIDDSNLNAEYDNFFYFLRDFYGMKETRAQYILNADKLSVGLLVVAFIDGLFVRCFIYDIDKEINRLTLVDMDSRDFHFVGANTNNIFRIGESFISRPPKAIICTLASLEPYMMSQELNKAFTSIPFHHAQTLQPSEQEVSVMVTSTAKSNLGMTTIPSVKITIEIRNRDGTVEETNLVKMFKLHGSMYLKEFKSQSDVELRKVFQKELLIMLMHKNYFPS